ncbi:MAG: type II toxin-antitoxin system RelB/DinJ family antitoxin [Oscillospiraceae bacterium]|nr:type II toxin-antitoxin system RelB/DinJ family antitoxin [Oscillospiraceae bacterium]
MAQGTLSIRMDNTLKEQFHRMCEEFGMSVSTAVTLFAKAILREQKIPFEIAAVDPFYSDYNQARLNRAIANLDAGRGTEHELIEVDDDA